VVARYAQAEDAHQFSRVVVEAVASLPGDHPNLHLYAIAPEA
jgi:hypothetical protein